ncbi:MAG: hypothetical protein KTR17_05755 [Cellvibrionaceae bacterium]|nr:hypothetical protein [Cellvibrionaceae bacterium]
MQQTVIGFVPTLFYVDEWKICLMGYRISPRYPTLAALLVSSACTLIAQAAFAGGCQNKADLPPVSGKVVKVSSVSELHSAVAQLQDHTTLLLAPGNYLLQTTLFIKNHHVTLRGDGENCEQTVLTGKGMENPNHGDVIHGVWSNAKYLTVTNLSIRDVYQHGIILNSGAQAPKISSVRLLDTGAQFIKSNPTGFGEGVNNGIVEYSEMMYTASPPTTDHGGGKGYTNGVDVHAGRDWVIRYNRFENFHTPDSSQWWWNPAVLMWNGASGTLVDGNVFINVDRAIALGLVDRSKDAGRASSDTDHRGGMIRNNMIVYHKGLFSRKRKWDSDAAIIVWDSPQTKVVHNTILTNSNLSKSIEFRFDTSGAMALNNLVDTRLGARNAGSFRKSGNVSVVTGQSFVKPELGNLHLVKDALEINGSELSDLAPLDIDGEARSGPKVEPGADEYSAVPSLELQTKAAPHRWK